MIFKIFQDGSEIRRGANTGISLLFIFGRLKLILSVAAGKVTK